MTKFSALPGVTLSYKPINQTPINPNFFKSYQRQPLKALSGNLPGLPFFLYISAMKNTFILSLLCFLTFTSAAAGKAEKAIRQILAAQATEWNKGSIEGYMKGYWESDSLLFIGKNGPTYGYVPTLERYKKSYPDASHMGHLTLTVIHVKKLSSRYYFVVGKWYLKREAGDVSGSYTLLFHRIAGKWTIICDHSS